MVALLDINITSVLVLVSLSLVVREFPLEQLVDYLINFRRFRRPFCSWRTDDGLRYVYFAIRC